MTGLQIVSQIQTESITYQERIDFDYIFETWETLKIDKIMIQIERRL